MNTFDISKLKNNAKVKQYEREEKRSSKCFVFGILSLLLAGVGCCVYPLSTIIAVILGIIAIVIGNDIYDKYGIKSSGKTLGILGIVISVVLTLFLVCVGDNYKQDVQNVSSFSNFSGENMSISINSSGDAGYIDSTLESKENIFAESGNEFNSYDK